MKRSAKWRADELDTYWDAAQRNDSETHFAGIDETTESIVAMLSQPPVSVETQAMQQRIRQQVTNSAKQLESQAQRDGIRVQLPAAPPTEFQAIHRRVNHWRASTNRAWLAAALIAAVFVTVASLGTLFVRDEATESTAVISAVVLASATPTTPMILESGKELFAITLPPAQLPQVDVAGSGFTHWTIPVGNSSQWVPTCCPGPLLQYVVAGDYEVAFDIGYQVVRGDGSIEEIPANGNANLGPGDALVSQNDATITATNTGDMPVEILQWNLIDDDNGAFSGRAVPGWSMLFRDVQGPELDSVPVTVRLLQVTMQPGITLVPPPGTYIFAVNSLRNQDGTPQPTGIYGRDADGFIASVGKSEVILYLLTMEQPQDASATPSLLPLPLPPW